MKQINIIKLIILLLKNFIKHGNLPVYYHICGHSESHNNPMEAETVEIRTSCDGEKN